MLLLGDAAPGLTAPTNQQMAYLELPPEWRQDHGEPVMAIADTGDLRACQKPLDPQRWTWLSQMVAIYELTCLLHDRVGRLVTQRTRAQPRRNHPCAACI